MPQKSKYDKDKAIKYASDWYDSFNPHYPYYVRGDCANFVSQCLHEGGILDCQAKCNTLIKIVNR